MDQQKPTLEEWRRLYDLAEQVKALKPWEWMDETDIFGIQHPEDNRLGFVSVMGGAGEHFSIALYLGSEGLYGFWDVQDSAPFVNPMEILSIPQVQVSFGSRDELEDEDRKIIKALGLKFRGKTDWTQFRSYSPGLFPWFIARHEAEFLTLALEQLLEFAPRVRDNPEVLFAEATAEDGENGEFNPFFDDDDIDEEEEVLVRVPVREGDTITWTEQWMTIPFPDLPKIPLALDMHALNRAKKLKNQRVTLELGVFILPSPVVEDPDARPFFPHLMLAVDSQTGAILSNDMLQPLPNQNAMWSEVPTRVLNGFESLGFVPSEIRVMSELLEELLKPIAKACKFKLTLVDELPALFEAQDSLAAFMGAPGMMDMSDEDFDDFPFRFP